MTDWKPLVVHPGEHIQEELEARGVTQQDAAKAMGISKQFLSDVIHGRRSVSFQLACRLSAYFGTSRLFWIRLQDAYDADSEI